MAEETKLTENLSLHEINKRLEAHNEAYRVANQLSDSNLRLAAAHAFSIPVQPVLIQATPAAAQAKVRAEIATAKARAPKA